MKRIIPILLPVLLLVFCQQAFAATNEDYACAPPYLSLHAKPNINILLDVSGSMQQPAYRDCNRTGDTAGSPNGYVSGCATQTVAGTELYDSTREYYGYFNQEKYYKYNATGGYFEENTDETCDKSDRIGSISGTGSTGCLSGNLINWIVTTRLDTVRKIFTGGRVKSGTETTTTAVLESDGAKYTYTEPNLQCTFTVNATNNAANTSSISYTETRKLTIANQSGKTCKLGALTTAAYTNVLTPIEDISGVVQSLYNQAVLEVSVFAEDAGDYRVGKGQALENYLDAINNELAYGATPTGTGMLVVQNFYQQSNAQALVSGKANYLIDPFYDSNGATTPISLPVPCRKSFNLLISDGMWPNLSFSENLTTSTADPVPYAYNMHTVDQRTDTGLDGKQTITTYVVYAYGDGDYGRNSLIATAIFGGFDDLYGAHVVPPATKDGWPYPFTAIPKDSRSLKTSVNYTPYALSLCNSTGTWHKECEEWAKKETGLPYNYFEGDDGAALQQAIKKALENMLKKTSSGTAASILGNNDNSGSTLLQALFYPEKEFIAGGKATWIGELQSFWYYVDPSLSNITIREDSENDKKLNLSQDKIIEFSFDGTGTLVNQFVDLDGNGAKDTPSTVESTVTTDEVNALWRAGKKLWARNPAERNIFTSDPLNAATKLNFKYESTTDDPTVTALFRYMGTYIAPVSPTTENDAIAMAKAKAIDIIRYVGGIDVSTNYRNRTVTIGEAEHVWKLGDIIHSTPKLLSEVRLNSYNLRQPGGYSDKSYDQYTKSKDYNRRGTAYVGANDGMLHAFKLGSNLDGTTRGTVAEIRTINDDGTTSEPTDLGKELWAFIPKNTLPYLKYLLDPSYQHIYMVDATPLLVDVSINPTKYTKSDSTIIACDDATYSQCVKQADVKDQLLNYDITLQKGGTSWRTLLLGSTGMGGAASIGQAKIEGNVNKISVTGDGKHFQCAGCDFDAAGFKSGMIFKASGFVKSGNNGYFIATDVAANKIACSGLDKNEPGGVPTGVLQQITVKTPIKDPEDATKGFGYSSVFALDVTDPVTSDDSYPKLLWEFSDPRLGFTTVTPAIMRINFRNPDGTIPSPQRNGKWYAILASGPTGPIDDGWFLGLSDKKLTIFVLDLKTGELVRTFNNLPSSDAYNSVNSAVHTQVAGMPDYAFAGSLSGATTDTDKHESSLDGAYSDDAVYIGYTRANSTTAPTAWDKGGVVRLLTYNDPDPRNWKVSTLIDGIGPVTSAVTKLQDKTASQLWLYFGTGRYYTKEDDPSNVQSLFGIMDPCFISGNIFAPDCNTNNTYAAPTVTAATSSSGATFTGLVDQTGSIVTVAATDKGWKIDLPTGNGTNYAKRVITDTLANTNGVVNFTTFTPSKDVCSYGGETSVWAVKYNTGGSGASRLKGQLLMQLSTGAFQQVDMSSAFTLSGDRETLTYKGVPPSSPPVITGNTNHFPTKRFLHIQER